ncbi:SDR family NAD(P)-dependent oxidoreductase [Mesorhizobium sp. STM 4661]|uniref:SDR family NAD(P)-dependent oxidoreductase n=1 Tax=Mesorhizobium sp. STM 4661 TaxID=1297570 RepID=UPI0002BD978A
MKQVVLITGASSGFGRMMANALAASGHTVHASMRGLSRKNAGQIAEVATYAQEHKVDLRTVALDVQSDASATSAIGGKRRQ